MKFNKGDRITGQPKTWYDGTPIKNWPDPQFIGTVRKAEYHHGLEMYRIKYDSGRLEWNTNTRLIKID